MDAYTLYFDYSECSLQDEAREIELDNELYEHSAE